ncbi:MAG: hypothetical protein KGI50_02455 [Patescibacteria group bacterium]|nr:hypothetical protein [Patescibacteria group bacterium]MDE2437793.1 hypothetical protein [Patescibacteria group bacterium]
MIMSIFTKVWNMLWKIVMSITVGIISFAPTGIFFWIKSFLHPEGFWEKSVFLSIAGFCWFIFQVLCWGAAGVVYVEWIWKQKTEE